MIGDLVRTRTIGILDPSQARLERLSAAFEHEYATLFRFAYFLTADRNTAEDLVQEAFLRVYRAGSRVNPAHVRAFARKVILNLNRSAFR